MNRACWILMSPHGLFPISTMNTFYLRINGKSLNFSYPFKAGNSCIVDIKINDNWNDQIKHWSLLFVNLQINFIWNGLKFNRTANQKPGNFATINERTLGCQNPAGISKKEDYWVNQKCPRLISRLSEQGPTQEIPARAQIHCGFRI